MKAFLNRVIPADLVMPLGVLIELAIFTLVIFIAVSCAKADSPNEHDPQWYIVQSPNTGQCYEVVAWSQGSGQTARMAAAGGTISCEYLRR